METPLKGKVNVVAIETIQRSLPFYLFDPGAFPTIMIFFIFVYIKAKLTRGNFESMARDRETDVGDSKAEFRNGTVNSVLSKS